MREEGISEIPAAPSTKPTLLWFELLSVPETACSLSLWALDPFSIPLYSCPSSSSSSSPGETIDTDLVSPGAYWLLEKNIPWKLNISLHLPKHKILRASVLKSWFPSHKTAQSSANSLCVAVLQISKILEQDRKIPQTYCSIAFSFQSWAWIWKWRASLLRCQFLIRAFSESWHPSSKIHQCLYMALCLVCNIFILYYS